MSNTPIRFKASESHLKSAQKELKDRFGISMPLLALRYFVPAAEQLAAYIVNRKIKSYKELNADTEGAGLLNYVASQSIAQLNKKNDESKTA